MSVRMRHTKGHTRNRRSHHALKTPRLSNCQDCGALHLRHRVCETCGKYKGK
ncbi:MAG TPA: 50S ribosomal protein L32, partial [Candidatus Moranbacteria bacterium]|nr:50S ribosomal protein L32 [Candidatus Moranbacteria bacterium]